MTPKEKAKELFDKYRDVSISFIDSIEGNGDMRMNNEDSKECALIVVDETINALGRLNIDILHNGVDFSHLITELRTNYNSHIIYWNEVKQEIEKL